MGDYVPNPDRVIRSSLLQLEILRFRAPGCLPNPTGWTVLVFAEARRDVDLVSLSARNDLRSGCDSYARMLKGNRDVGAGSHGSEPGLRIRPQ